MYINQKGFSVILISIGVLIFGGAILGAYYLGAQKTEPVASTNTPAVEEQNTPVITTSSPSSIPTTEDKCPSGLKQFSNEYFSICYPTDMTSTFEEFVSTNGAKGVKAIFTNGTDSILVQSDFIGGWGGGNCIFTEKTTIAGFPADSVSWKEELPDGNCGEIYTAFATIITVSSERQPYYIGISNKDGKLSKKYTPAFNSSIQQSFKINKL